MAVDKQIPKDKRLKIGGAAELVQVSEGTLRNYGAAGQFPDGTPLWMWQHPTTGHRYFHRDEITAYALKKFGPPPTETGGGGKRRARAHAR